MRFEFPKINSNLRSFTNNGQLSDWYRVSVFEVEQTREGRELSRIHKTFPGALRALHPDFAWDISRFNLRDVQLLVLANIGKALGITQVHTSFICLFVLLSLLAYPFIYPLPVQT